MSASTVENFLCLLNDRRELSKRIWTWHVETCIVDGLIAQSERDRWDWDSMNIQIQNNFVDSVEFHVSRPARQIMDDIALSKGKKLLGSCDERPGTCYLCGRESRVHGVVPACRQCVEGL